MRRPHHGPGDRLAPWAHGLHSQVKSNVEVSGVSLELGGWLR